MTKSDKKECFFFLQITLSEHSQQKRDLEFTAKNEVEEGIQPR